MRIRKANPKDFAEICGLIEKYADQGLLLPRTAEDIRAHLDRFLVLAKPQGPMSKEHLLGCVSLEPYGEELAELRSLAVAPEARGFGAGAKLIAACMDLARERGISRLCRNTRARCV